MCDKVSLGRLHLYLGDEAEVTSLMAVRRGREAGLRHHMRTVWRKRTTTTTMIVMIVLVMIVVIVMMETSVQPVLHGRMARSLELICDAIQYSAVP